MASVGVKTLIDQPFWEKRKVFVTGHTGFKGGWLVLWLQCLGAVVKGYALKPVGSTNLYSVANVSVGAESEFGDINDLEKLVTSIRAFKPDIVMHLAAQSLVRNSYDFPVETYKTNVLGTAHLLEAVRLSGSASAVLNITSDKCYENKEWFWGYRESDAMGGYDPYSNSKGCAELVTSSYRRSFYSKLNIGLATARAGNVIGGGDWAEGRVIPDAVRAFAAGETLNIRNPFSIRPWQHVLEPLAGYLILVQRLVETPNKYSQGWNFGPGYDDARQVSDLVDEFCENWGGGVSWEQDEVSHPHEASYLKLDCSKANLLLGWMPKWNCTRALSETVDWYKAWLDKKDMRKFSLEQIDRYSHERV